MVDSTPAPVSPPSCVACTPAEFTRLIASDPALARRWRELPRRHYAAGESLLRIGDAAAQVWLIERGLVRFFFLSEQGVERNKSFHAEGAWIGGGMPPQVTSSPYGIEAIEPVDVVELSYAELTRCLVDFPSAQPVLMGALAWTFARQSARGEQLLTLDATQRLRSFLADQPEVARRLPLHHVASHLGITNVALSRIRQRLGLGDGRRGRSAT